MRTPPSCIIRMAKYHWLTAGAIVVAVIAVFVFALLMPRISVTGTGYAVSLSLAALYGLTGGLLWIGNRAALVLNQVCSLPYLARPNIGEDVWAGIRSEEYKMYFRQGLTTGRG